MLWRLAHTPDRLTGDLLSDVKTRDEAASLLAAGDVTVRPLTWIWYLLALHPEVALARRFRFRMAGEAPVTLLGGISLQPRGGMRMQVEERL